MPFVPDSREAGYLGPLNSGPSHDDPWADFLCDIVAGVTGLDRNALVRPLWQPEPPTQPDFTVDWVGVGVTNTEANYTPAVIHYGTGNGFDALQQFETATVLCAFYGPNAQGYAGLLRDGMFIDQNRAALRAAGVGFKEFGGIVRNAEKVNEQWLNRADINMIVVREVRRNYPVLNLLSARGVIKANDPGRRIVQNNWDTSNQR